MVNLALSLTNQSSTRKQRDSNARLPVTEFQDATDNSSSFGGTMSGDENDSAISDAEVESALSGGSPFGSLLDGLFQMRCFLKRKLTDHWRRFIHPLMWRLKWLELQLKELKSQASRYDREIVGYDQKRKFEYEKFTIEGLNVKSQPFQCQVQRKKVMKRRKRKRIENMTDLASYMSCHNIYSYYGMIFIIILFGMYFPSANLMSLFSLLPESKKSVIATATLDDDNGKLGTKTDYTNDDFGFIDDLSHLEFSDSDTLSEQILRKIDLLQSQAHKLKTRVDKTVNESPRKFSSINMLSSPALTGSRNQPSPTRSGDRALVRSQHTSSQHRSKSHFRVLFRPGSAVSSHGEVTPFPDMIEGSGQHLAGISYENTEDDILIHNQAAKEELQNFQSGLTQQAEESRIPIEKPKTVCTALAPADNPPTNPPVPPNVKLTSTSKSKGPSNKRKRGKRKSGTGKWSRRSSG
ncbi:uncharacterized protein [Gossypium hirsutum]|uniref:Uncharacterized protein isoform X8 n=1 Tax=Gossypium hirsutum TaxID=3635 RepID=A0ABM2Z510_GOSHI|nr:uncharacterized protein LOC107900197 isoform X8 [Gossypium hirsutum]